MLEKGRLGWPWLSTLKVAQHREEKKRAVPSLLFVPKLWSIKHLSTQKVLRVFFRFNSLDWEVRVQKELTAQTIETTARSVARLSCCYLPDNPRGPLQLSNTIILSRAPNKIGYH